MFTTDNNDEIILKVTDEEIEKINYIINDISNEINEQLKKLKNLELSYSNKYDFNKNKKLILQHSKLVNNVIKKVLDNYKLEMKNLEIVFLACSFGRQTNKLESDLDLHFIYKNNDYNFKYEEIVCYIITKVLNLKRDDIDPKFIINFNNKLKKQYENNMTNNDLTIILKSENQEIKYNYLASKKKKFFLQYGNVKTTESLKKYIINYGIVNNNNPWAHSFQIIIGKQKFKKMYNEIFKIEKDILNSSYLLKQCKILKREINLIKLNVEEKNISIIKKNFQTNVFTCFYKFLNIIRLNMIKSGLEIKNLKIYELYDKVDTRYKKIINNILIYIWNIKNISLYCNLNDIDYSIHINSEIGEIDLSKLKEQYLKIKKEIIDIIEEIEVNNGKERNINFATNTNRKFKSF